MVMEFISRGGRFPEGIYGIAKLPLPRNEPKIKLDKSGFEKRQ